MSKLRSIAELRAFYGMHGLGTYIAASYVKWIEAAGGRVVPLIAGSNQNFTQVCTSMFEEVKYVFIYVYMCESCLRD